MACVKTGIFERPPERSNSYYGFVDPSGGSNDSFTLAIAHKEGKTNIVDLVRDRPPPFSPESAIEEYAGILKKYRITSVKGDRYAGEFPREQFRKHGVNYEPSELRNLLGCGRHHQQRRRRSPGQRQANWPIRRPETSDPSGGP
jgi:hypothetical protein